LEQGVYSGTGCLPYTSLMGSLAPHWICLQPSKPGVGVPIRVLHVVTGKQESGTPHRHLPCCPPVSQPSVQKGGRALPLRCPVRSSGQPFGSHQAGRRRSRAPASVHQPHCRQPVLGAPAAGENTVFPKKRKKAGSVQTRTTGPLPVLADNGPEGWQPCFRHSDCALT
jgi:hypothetical protein